MEHQVSADSPAAGGDGELPAEQLGPPNVEQLRKLRGEVAVLRERLAAAGLIVEEREQRIRDLRGALRIISAGLLQAGAQERPSVDPRWGGLALPPSGPAGGREASARAVPGSGPGNQRRAPERDPRSEHPDRPRYHPGRVGHDLGREGHESAPRGHDRARTLIEGDVPADAPPSTRRRIRVDPDAPLRGAPMPLPIELPDDEPKARRSWMASLREGLAEWRARGPGDD